MTQAAPNPVTYDRNCVDASKAIPVDERHQLTTSIYYGVRSYLHHFYEPSSRSYVNDESGLEDDFEFVVEPGRRKNGCWFYVCIGAGLILLVVGIALILVGNVTPLKNPMVDVQGNLEILDQKAIEFNRNVRTCQLCGLMSFCAGGIVVMLTLLVSAYERECGCRRVKNRILRPTTVDPHAWIRYANSYAVDDGARIPLSREIKAVQIEKEKH